MLAKTNIETMLHKTRDRRIPSETILAEVSKILEENTHQRDTINENLKKSGSDENDFDVNLLNADKIFHLKDIKKLCVIYRLRFLDSHFFKGDIPEEAISKIRQLEKEHDTPLSGFKVMAPAKLLKLENADDPLLFAPIGNDYFYLIHKWGNDLHPFRKLLMWPYKSFENLVFTVFLVSILLTAMTPMNMFTHTAHMQEYFLMFLFMFKAVGGIVLFYGFAKGKNFNGAIWDSKYYNG
ncbi:MAG: hypothetical protein KJO05_06930 [Bacteroidia bacterium]|nr:hypothetical protein [Bacteroidia bacterium]MBT8275314.1 hypothetical protein [Bacteroidia bacterium]NNF30595.1 hypothetical protein [Flavobacteriaceae bacterium]NNK54793.1 hypothetical protein [Flavobacteriaceae bacterium]NNM09665.1 hypothetical protein [Flavobacteriaceae bacterium]